MYPGSRDIENGKAETAKWYLERRDKDFKPKNDLTSDDKALPTPLLAYEVLNNQCDKKDNEPNEEN